MSGHSKWSTIKHQKSVADQRRGQVFAKLVKAISIAAREGADPETNFKLRLAIEKAKEANVPKANIDRAIDRAVGGGAAGELETVVYEGYGPAKIAVIVEAATDNRNRTTAEIKKIFEQNGGVLAGPGAVAYLFDNAGQIMVEKPADLQEAILKIMDLEINDVEETDGGIEVYVSPAKLETIAQKLKKLGLIIKSKSLVKKPKSLLTIKQPEKKKKVLSFMENLDEHDDVQEVFANFDLVD